MTTAPGESWVRSVTPQQWRTLAAAMLGWLLDAMDVMMYAFALNSIRAEFALSAAAAGGLASVTLLTSAVGGVGFGMLADRIGRAKALVYSILIYSVFTALTATARSLPELILWRSLVGIGLGGEWAAGSVLVAETWPAEHRGKAIGLMQSGWAIGYILAALLASAILPSHGWRVLFAIGVLPALLAVWIRRKVPEPEIWQRGAGVERRPLGEILRPPPPAQRRSRDRAHELRPVRVLGSVHLGTSLPREPGRDGRRRDEHRALLGVDHPDAGGRVPRLRAVRGARGPLREAAGVHLLRAGRGLSGTDLRPDGAPPRDADGDGAADRLLRPRLLQRVRRHARGALPVLDPWYGPGALLQPRAGGERARAVRYRGARR